tara:strand:- start:144 stop:542 length:399 start_codon:yes stop_codon:yes gene_type:complete
MANWNWNGRFYAQTYYTVSDERFKNNIRPLENVLETLSKIKGKRYEMKIDGKNEIGLIAQEIMEYYPNLVDELDYKNEGTRMAVNYTGFVPILINAINEQQVMIKELQEKVDEIDELKEELESLKQLIINNN